MAEDIIYYPDVMLVCDPEDVHPRIKTRPILIVEALSPSTTRVDRREKLLAYRGLAALEAYLIAHQDQPLIERHWRDEHGAWQQTRLRAGAVPLPGVDAELALADLYRDLPPA